VFLFIYNSQRGQCLETRNKILIYKFMIKKFKIFEGIKWYSNGKLSELLPDLIEDEDATYVNDYLGNRIKQEDAVWCEYDKVWCKKEDAFRVDYLGIWTTPEIVPFDIVRENLREFDPYGEEDWDELNLKKGDIVKILPKFEWYLNNTRNRWNKELHMKFIGKTAEVINPFYVYNNTNCCLVTRKDILKSLYADEPWEEHMHGGFIIPLDCVEKIERSNESINEVDPYGEEEWEQESIEMGNTILSLGDKIINCKDTDIYGIIEKIIGNNIYLKRRSHEWMVNSDDIYDWVFVKGSCRIEKVE
jgi:hypothetical protein